MPSWMFLLPMIALPVLALAFLTVWRRKGPRSGPEVNASILQMLKRTGFDLSQPMNLSFLLYFDTEERARMAATQFPSPEWRTEISPPEKRALWLCTASTTAVPTMDTIQEYVAHCEAVAAAAEGQYDGWMAANT
jgi:hypothetical protein